VAARETNYLTESEIVELHERVIGQFGGMPGIRDRGALASCASQPMTAVFGVERFPSVHEKAAAYCFFIIRLHPFFDGNKRAGLVAAIAFLIDHGVTPIFDENEMFDLIIRVATGKAELDDLTVAFRRADCADANPDDAH